MGALSPQQKLLADYLNRLKLPLFQRLYLLWLLWEPEATAEMLQYIADAQPQALSQLEAAACRIAKKWSKDPAAPAMPAGDSG